MWIVTRDFDWARRKEWGDGDAELNLSWIRAGRYCSFDDETVTILEKAGDYSKFQEIFEAKLKETGHKPVRIRSFVDDYFTRPAYEALATSEDDCESFFLWSQNDYGTAYTMYEDFRGHWRYLHG